MSPPPPAPPSRPPPRRIDGPLREREFLEDGEEVTRVTDRDLVIRAVNSTLRTEHALGVMAAEVGSLVRRIDSLAHSVSEADRERKKLRESIPDFVEAAERLNEAVEEITDHGQNRPPERSDSERVRVIVREERNSDELEQFRRRVSFRWDVAKQILGASGAVGLVELLRVLFTHHW